MSREKEADKNLCHADWNLKEFFFVVVASAIYSNQQIIGVWSAITDDLHSDFGVGTLSLAVGATQIWDLAVWSPNAACGREKKSKYGSQSFHDVFKSLLRPLKCPNVQRKAIQAPRKARGLRSYPPKPSNCLHLALSSSESPKCAEFVRSERQNRFFFMSTRAFNGNWASEVQNFTLSPTKLAINFNSHPSSIRTAQMQAKWHRNKC